jgi:enediyne biosynthesis protein E5
MNSPSTTPTRRPGPPAAGAPAPGRGGLDRLNAFLTPKVLVSALITLILVLGEWRFGALGGYPRLAVALGCCMLTEAALSWFMIARRPLLLSSYVSGNSLALLLKPLGPVLWPFALGAMLSIGSKYVLRYRGRHLWNPTNFAITALVLLAPSQVAILSEQFGNDLRVNGVIWLIGLVVVARARLLHVTAAYVIAFFVLAGVRHLVTGTPLLAEIAPITGPMYQLFIFFMITDPPTTVSTRRGRIGVVVLIALVEAAIRLGNDFHVSFLEPLAPIPAIAALAIVGPLAKALDLRRRG